MALISADVQETMDNILPREQNLFPVSFKRKLQYEGHYIREIIDRLKCEIWYYWLLKNNIHFFGKEFQVERIDEFCDSIHETIKEIEEEIVHMINPEDEIFKEPEEEIPLAKQMDTLLCDKYEPDIDSNTVSNKLADIILQFELKSKIPADEILVEEDSEEFFDDFVLEEDYAEVPKKRSK